MKKKHTVELKGSKEKIEMLLKLEKFQFKHFNIEVGEIVETDEVIEEPKKPVSKNVVKGKPVKKEAPKKEPVKKTEQTSKKGMPEIRYSNTSPK